MNDSPVDYLQKGAEPIVWAALVGKLLGVEASEECVFHNSNCQDRC